jgi:hypothetical protein
MLLSAEMQSALDGVRVLISAAEFEIPQATVQDQRFRQLRGDAVSRAFLGLGSATLQAQRVSRFV